ncbi:MAG: trypsin-like peptidase domain-containing protein [Longimicrobiales bacterium]
MGRITYRIAGLVAIGVLLAVVTATWPPERRAETTRPAVRLATAATSSLSTSSAPASAVQTLARRQGTVPEARAFSRAFADVAEAVLPAVVRIQSEQSTARGSRMQDIFDQLPEGHPAPEFPTMAGGSGVLVSNEGLILTNNHVIAGAQRITVTLWDKRRFEATVVGTDPTTDLALIRIDESGLPAADLGDSDSLRVGEWVLAVGNPGFRDANTLDFTVTGGIVSAKGRPLDVIREELMRGGDRTAAVYAIEDFIQTDAAINPGNSGGPLVDLDGTVVGLNTAIASLTGANQGYGFAVPINVAKRVMDDLVEYGRVRRPLLGISILNIAPEDAQAYGLERIAGVLVEDFADDSPAERAGMQRHDVIVAIDGTPVERIGQFQRLVAGYEPGDWVAVDVVRFGDRERFRVELTEANLGENRVVRTAARRSASPPGLGLELVNLTPSLARERGFPEAGGALIAEVVPGSAASRRGVPRGVVIREINRIPVSSVREAEEILDALGTGAVASLLLATDAGGTLIRNVRVP